MLIPSIKHTPQDLALWREQEEADLLHPLKDKPAKALEEMRSFCERLRAEKRGLYVGVSWGKDSTVVAHLASLLSNPPPLVFVRVEPIFNPDCLLVRDAFLQSHPIVTYKEYLTHARRSPSGWHASGTLEAGFKQAAADTGAAYISGVRAEESTTREIRCHTHGVSSKNTCAPLAWWSTQDVFTYLAVNKLPVHPAYAMQGGGRWLREHLRVASLGGRRGDGHGRAEWEAEYYGTEVRRIARST